MFCAVHVPPSIVEGPSAEVKYFTGAAGETLELPCRATGQPTPESVALIHTAHTAHCLNTEQIQRKSLSDDTSNAV